MVNEVVLNYLRANKGKYPIESLKARIISGGYSEIDFEEAMKALNAQAQPRPMPAMQARPIQPTQVQTPLTQIAKVQPKPVQEPSVQPTQTPPATNIPSSTPQTSTTPETPTASVKVAKTSGIKWMKIAGIIGFVLLALNLVFTILDVLDISILSAENGSNWRPITFGVVVLVLLCFYFLGFERFGKKVGANGMRYSAIIISVLLVLFASSYFWMGEAFSDVADLFGEGVFQGSQGNFSLLPVLFMVLVFTVFVVRYIFVISLIRKGWRVEFARAAGIVGLVVVVISTIFFAYTVYLSLNPTALQNFVSSDILDGVVVWAGLSFEILLFISLLMESITLMYASKNFEG